DMYSDNLGLCDN
nr:RecName: Full=Uncharacterized protein SMPP4 [Nautilus macromphalus]